MKVLQITAFSGWGCTGRIALGIHNALVLEGHESAIAWGRMNTAPENVPAIQVGNKYDQMLHGLYTRITDKCGFGSKRVTKQFLKKIEEYNPDLIQLHIIHGYYINLEILFNYIKEKDIPIVWTFHDCWAFTGHCPYFDFVGCNKWETGCHHCEQKSHHPRSWFTDNSAWNYINKRKLFTGINNMTIITPSEWLAGLVRKSFLKEYNVQVINNGINLNDFKPTEGSFKKNRGIEDKKIVLGVSSTWVKSKGLEDFAELSKKLPKQYVVVLVGLTKEQKDKLPSNMIGIERTDSIKELAELYTAAEVFVNPTYEDNYPTTNLEAIACGTPVITYDTGGSGEIIEKTGYGIIIPKHEIELLAKTIENHEFHVMKSDFEMQLSQELKFHEYVNLYTKIRGE